MRFIIHAVQVDAMAEISKSQVGLLKGKWLFF